VCRHTQRLYCFSVALLGTLAIGMIARPLRSIALCVFCRTLSTCMHARQLSAEGLQPAVYCMSSDGTVCTHKVCTVVHSVQLSCAKDALCACMQRILSLRLYTRTGALHSGTFECSSWLCMQPLPAHHCCKHMP
jgi:hypothetical protein